MRPMTHKSSCSLHSFHCIDAIITSLRDESRVHRCRSPGTVDVLVMQTVASGGDGTDARRASRGGRREDREAARAAGLEPARTGQVGGPRPVGGQPHRGGQPASLRRRAPALRARLPRQRGRPAAGRRPDLPPHSRRRAVRDESGRQTLLEARDVRAAAAAACGLLRRAEPTSRRPPSEEAGASKMQVAFSSLGFSAPVPDGAHGLSRRTAGRRGHAPPRDDGGHPVPGRRRAGRRAPRPPSPSPTCRRPWPAWLATGSRCGGLLRLPGRRSAGARGTRPRASPSASHTRPPPCAPARTRATCSTTASPASGAASCTWSPTTGRSPTSSRCWRTATGRR